MHNMKAYEEVETELHSIITRCRWEVSFTPQPLYFQKKSHQYPLNWRLYEPQSQSRPETLGGPLVPNQNWTMILAQSKVKLLRQPHYPSAQSTSPAT